ncbi:hypothetical protein [Catenulispora rubra]|uniref:hypothetical protein n=1 Tax=Catenulispora rubra TaxID=280293 RepID=UPI00189237A0|nr:hypothetical protein [Catenulispora rubra]
MTKKHRFLPRLAAALLAFAACLSLSQPAHAAGGPQPVDQAKGARGMAIVHQLQAAGDPAALIAKLSAADKDALGYVTAPASVTVTNTSARPAGVTPADYTGCWWDYQNQIASNVYGNALYSWWLRTQICADSGHTTSLQILSANGNIYPGWSWAWSVSAGPDTQQKDMGWEGRFEMHIQFEGPFFDDHDYCLQNRQNAIYYEVYANSQSCDINS